MHCPNCQTVNPEAAKFCFNCGTSLNQQITPCSNCGNDLVAGARFCMACGQPVAMTTPADADRLVRLAAATPVPLAIKMRAAHLSGERKIVTCLFADVVGSTALAERMDPDDWTAIMNRAFDLLSPAVYRYEGTIARLMGDAVLAFFGAPVAHEDDPVRAVYAALDMLDAARHYADEVRATYKIEFAIRVGLNTGTVVVGNVGSDLKYEYTAMGDAVNLAARMQSAARTMTTLISEHTFRFVAPMFDCQDLGPLEIKGKAEPVRVYEVQNPKATPDRLRGLQTIGLDSPMVGRDAELATLRALSDRLQNGSGGIVAIIGEAGLGKSRLLAEWKTPTPTPLPFENASRQMGEGVRWIEGHCLSYGQGLAYHLLIDLLRSLLGVNSRTSETDTQTALSHLCAEMLADSGAESSIYLAHLLGLPISPAAQATLLTLDPQSIQTHYRESLTAIIHALADQHPVVLICDDIHWADPSSVELLIKLLPLAASHAIGFCFLTRPDEETSGWKLITVARDIGLAEIGLTPLSEGEGRQLVANLLNVDALPESIRAQILAKAEGNPFFVEEVIRMLIDRAAILPQGTGWVAGREIGAVEIPDNVQGLLLARIDRLADEAKRVLRVASVIGRQFAVRVLRQIVNAVNSLPALEGYGLIRLAAPQPDLEYLFRHALVQEAAYQSLVKQDRKQLHLAVGEALEQLYADQVSARETAPLLAQHFYLGGEDARALKYLIIAGDEAASVYANSEAILHYSRALEIAKGNLISADLIHLYTSLGTTLELQAKYSEAMRLYSEMETLAIDQNDHRMEFKAVMARAKVLATPNPAFDPLAGRRVLQRALTLARETNDSADECLILWNLMILDIFGGGDMRQAVEHGEKSIALARKFNLRERLAFATQDINYAYVAIGRNDLAWASLYEASALWRELNNTPMLADNLGNMALHYFERGEYEDSIAKAEEAYRLYRSIDNVYGVASCRFCESGSYLDRGDYARAFEIIEEGMHAAQTAGNVAALVSLLMDLAYFYDSIGLAERGLVYARQAVTVTQESFPLWIPMAYARLSRLLTHIGDLSAAVEALAEAERTLKPESLVLYGREMIGLALCELKLAQRDWAAALTAAQILATYVEKTERVAFLPEALLFKARALQASDALAEAEAALEQARNRASQIGLRRVLWQVLAASSEVADKRGDERAAQKFRKTAADEISWLAGQLKSLELRQAFLSQSEVRAVVELSQIN